MSAVDLDPYTLLEASFQQAPSQLLRDSKHLPRRSDEYRTFSRTQAPLRRDDSSSTVTTQATDASDSTAQSQHSTPLASPGASNGADNGLPPTPPSASQDGSTTDDADQAPHADGLVNSLMAKKSSLSTPVNARSPPTPDPSPPRTSGSNGTNGTNVSNATNATNAARERPPMFAYPSSRAESFRTAREEPSSDRDDSRAVTPADARLSTVDEHRGLGLAFEQDESDVTPTNRPGPYFPTLDDADTTAGAEEDKGSPTVEKTPHREWNTELMRNVTLRKKRRPDSTSPRKRQEPDAAQSAVEAPSPTPSNARRGSSLRERVQASHNSPVTPSIENFAHAIGWPADESQRDASNKRQSTASVTSVVSAMVITTPPRNRQTLRHSGRNMAYRIGRDVSSPADLGSTTPSNRDSMLLDDVPPRRLVHKRTNIADRKKNTGGDTDTLYSQRMASPSLSLRHRTLDSSAYTKQHQESVRNVLQPAADILSRHSNMTRAHSPATSYHKRGVSAPEPSRRTTSSLKPRNFSQLSPPGSPRNTSDTSDQPYAFERPESPTRSPKPRRASPVSRKVKEQPYAFERTQSPTHSQKQRRPSPTLSPKPRRASPVSRKVRQRPQSVADAKLPTDIEKTLPNLPDQGTEGPADRDVFLGASHPVEDARVPSSLMDRVRQLVADRNSMEEGTLVVDSNPNPATLENLGRFSPLKGYSPPMRQGSRASNRYSWNRRRSSPGQDPSIISPDATHRPSLDGGMSSDDMFRRSPDYREHVRVSFDRSASRTEEHAMARHLYSQSTPFSQFSDTLEVSEAKAVSIFPHNNHSLLVVQQVSRGNSMMPEPHQLTANGYATLEDDRDAHPSPTPPFVDASEVNEDDEQDQSEKPPQPTLNFEPSTPPMNIDLPHTNSVDSPLTNPRAPPEPPKINFIPPTPMEELDRPLVPGPPERSDSHPQRRLSLAQRARRYSDNLITPLLARASYKKARESQSQRHTHRNPRVPNVNEGDGTLHPFWRPRGFWDDMDDTDSECDDEDDGLPQGGDTSDVEDPEPLPQRRTNKIGNKLKGSAGFLIGNSLGVERHGTNKRLHHVTLPRQSQQSGDSSLAVQGSGVSKRSSRSSLRSSASSFEQRHRPRSSWRQGRSLPGLGRYHVQYIGISGVKDRLRERRVEKRREKIRRSIGSRYYMEPASP